MRKHLLISLCLTLALAACNSNDTPINDDNDVVETPTAEPAKLNLYPGFFVHSNIEADTSIIYTSASAVTIDGIRFDEYTYVPFGVKLEVGDSLKYEWLKIKMLENALQFSTEIFTDPELEYEYYIYCSGELDSDSIIAYKGPTTVMGGDDDVLELNPDEINVPSEGGSYHITTDTNNWTLISITLDGVTYSNKNYLEKIFGDFTYVAYDEETGLPYYAQNYTYEGRLGWLYLKRDYQDIYLDVEPNNGDARESVITLFHGDIFPKIKIYQEGIQ